MSFFGCDFVMFFRDRSTAISKKDVSSRSKIVYKKFHNINLNWLLGFEKIMISL